MDQRELTAGMSPFDANGADSYMVLLNADGTGLPDEVAKKFPSLAKAVKAHAGAGKFKPGDCGLWQIGSTWWALPIVRADAKEKATFSVVRQAIETAGAKIVRAYALAEMAMWFPSDYCGLPKGRDDLELALTSIEDHAESDFVLWVPRDERVKD